MFLKTARILVRSLHSSCRLLMSKPYLTHEERTAAEPRHEGLHSASITRILQVNSTVRAFRLSLADRRNGLQFQAGQWLDVFVPGSEKAGGFTITSAPENAMPSVTDSDTVPWLELAVQESPRNPPAAWLWRPTAEVQGATVHIRVGGSFTWPPHNLTESQRRRVVLIAGGVGINPIMSYLNHFSSSARWPDDVQLLYSSRCQSLAPPAMGNDPILFDSPIRKIADSNADKFHYSLFLTGESPTTEAKDSQGMSVNTRRMTFKDVEMALGPVDARSSSVVYVCGPQAMTDSFIETISTMAGMSPERVLCEKWW